MSYQLGLFSASQLPGVAAFLNNDIVNTYSTHPSSGIIGVKALLPTLAALNMSDIALALVSQTSQPSWGYMFYNDYEPANSSLWELYVRLCSH